MKNSVIYKTKKLSGKQQNCYKKEIKYVVVIRRRFKNKKTPADFSTGVLE